MSPMSRPPRLRRYLVFGVFNLLLAAAQLANVLTGEPRRTGGLLLAGIWLLIACGWFWQWQWRRTEPSRND